MTGGLRHPVVDIVVKIGGGLLAHPAHFAATMTAVEQAAGECRLLVVPGGGPFADAVRALDQQLRFSDDAAHWMAVLAMDQYAHVILSRLARGSIATSPTAVRDTLLAGQIPILAASEWLRARDPRPHSWDVTSDSIAAWVAGELGAGHLVLVKPPDAREPLVDPYFSRALPHHVRPVMVRAGESLSSVLEAR